MANVLGSVVVLNPENEQQGLTAQQKRFFLGPVAALLAKIFVKKIPKLISAIKPATKVVIKPASKVAKEVAKKVFFDSVTKQEDSSKNARSFGYFCTQNCSRTNRPVCVTNGTQKISFANHCEFKKALICCASFGQKNTGRK